MKKRWLLNLALALLVGALVLVAVYKPGAKKEAEGAPLTALAADAVQRIRLLRPNQPEIVLEKSGNTWRLTAPRAARANGFRIGDITRLATTRARTRFPAVATELGKYGLDKPVASVFLNDTEIRFGSLHPLSNDLYVLHADQVQLIPAQALRSASVPLGDLLSPALLEDKVKLVSLRFPGFRLQQNEHGAWARTPERQDLASDTVNRFVEEWRHARALSVGAYSGKPFKERITVTVTDGDKQRAIEFGVLARKPELVIVRLDEKLEYHFGEDAVSRLLELNPDVPAGAAAPAKP
jgi:hypothetical protein